MSIASGKLLEGADENGVGEAKAVPARKEVTLYPVADGSTTLDYLVEGQIEAGTWHPVHEESLSGAEGALEPIRVDGFFRAFRATVSGYTSGELTIDYEVF